MANPAEKTHKFTIEPGDDGQRLDLYVKGQLPDFSRSQIQKWLKTKHVLLDGAPAKGAEPIRPGMEISVTIPEEQVRLVAEDIPLDILFEDAHLIVINKPAGMVTHPSAGHHKGTLANALWHYLSKPSNFKISKSKVSKLDEKSRRPGIVHRLDRDTSGVLVAAKNLKIQEALASQFRVRNVQKVYRAIAVGKVAYKEGEIEGAIGKDLESSRMAVISTGKFSKTGFKVLKRFPGHTYLELYPKTGRTHQIRVHLAKIGHPVLGDNLYGGLDPAGLDKAGASCKRHMLHAYSIELTHPVTKKRVTFTAPLPADFQETLRRLKS